MLIIMIQFMFNARVYNYVAHYADELRDWQIILTNVIIKVNVIIIIAREKN